MNELSLSCNKKGSKGICLQRIWIPSNNFIPYFVYDSTAYRCNERGDQVLSKGVSIWVQLEYDSYNLYEL